MKQIFQVQSNQRPSTSTPTLECDGNTGAITGALGRVWSALPAWQVVGSPFTLWAFVVAPEVGDKHTDLP